MGRELTAVVVMDGGVYGPGYINPPPDHLVARITNPAVWGDEDEAPAEPASPQGSDAPKPEEPSAPPAQEPAEPPAPVEPEAPAAPEPVEEPETPVEPKAEPVPVPPRSGAGSGAAAWRAFADYHKVSYPANAGREEIIEACEEAKVI